MTQQWLSYTFWFPWVGNRWKLGGGCEYTIFKLFSEPKDTQILHARGYMIKLKSADLVISHNENN